MKKNIKKLILLLITFVFLYFVFVNINISKFINTFKDFNCNYIFLLVLLIAITQSMRAICFKQLIHKTVPQANLPYLIFLCLASAGANIILPARAGDFFRAYFTGEKYNMSKIKAFGSIILERLFDVISIFIILMCGIFIYQRNPLAVKLCLITACIIVFACLFAIVTYKHNNLSKICDFIEKKTENLPFSNFIQKVTTLANNICNSFFNGFEVIESPKRILYAFISSMGIWFCECLCYIVTIQGFGYNIHWSVVLFIIPFIALGCIIPSASVFLGPYQIAVITAFAIYNIPKETALAISVVEQSVVTVFLCAVTFIFLLKNNISYKEIKDKINEKMT